jgi:hypothetical protein
MGNSSLMRLDFGIQIPSLVFSATTSAFANNQRPHNKPLDLNNFIEHRLTIATATPSTHTTTLLDKMSGEQPLNKTDSP